MRRLTFALLALTAAIWSYRLQAQTAVTYDRLLNTAKEPHNWLTYGGDYFSHRYSPLTQITPANAKNLSLSWAYQSPQSGSWQATEAGSGFRSAICSRRWVTGRSVL